MPQNCDSIDWLVDILGTTDFLAKVLDAAGFEGAVFTAESLGRRRSSYKMTDQIAQEHGAGLYFDGAHWHSFDGQKLTDSYTEQFQQKGTAHFCQTFAVMIHTRSTDKLTPTQLSTNIRAAMQFWIDTLGKDVALQRMILREIKTSNYADEGRIAKVGEDEIPLDSITWAQLKRFMLDVQESAASLVGCREG